MSNLRETGNNKTPFTVNFIDLDNDNASLAHLEEAKLDDLNVGQIISTLQQKGYRLVNNGFDPHIDSNAYDFVVTFRHSYQTIDADHPTNEFPVDSLRRIGTQTVHYEGAGTRTPIDNKSQIVINRSLIYDQVEKKVIKDNGWEKKSFQVIGTPDVAGYIPSDAYVGGDTVNYDNPNRHYEVDYEVNREPSQTTQTALVKFLDIDNKNKEVATSGELSGTPNTKIDYSPIGTINFLKNQGYHLVTNGFDNDGEVQFFDNSDLTTQTYIISVRHELVKVDSDHPFNGIDPKEYEQDIIATVHYTGAGDNTPNDNRQIIKKYRQVTVDSVTKEVLNQTDWQTHEKSFAAVTTPIIKGYHADKGLIGSKIATTDHLDEIVNYTPNGRIIPIDEDGNEIPGAPHPTYQTDPKDATKVLSSKSLPEIDGYAPRVDSIDPNDPSTDTKVVYNKKLIVQLKALEDRGYAFVNNGLNADTVARSIDSEDHGTQTYVIGLTHGHQNVTPENPGHPGEKINPNFDASPLWPKGTGREDLIRVGWQIIKYQGANGLTPKANEQKTEFDRTLVIDKVTGKIIKDNGWNADQRQFGTVNTPVIRGYHADKRIAGGNTIRPEHLEEVDVVNYRSNGYIIPVDPNGQQIAGAKHLQYQTDSNDPTKVIPNEAVPEVAGYTPTQIAVTPSRPEQDTPVVYNPDRRN